MIMGICCFTKLIKNCIYLNIIINYIQKKYLTLFYFFLPTNCKNCPATSVLFNYPLAQMAMQYSLKDFTALYCTVHNCTALYCTV